MGHGWVIERNGKQLTKYRWSPVLRGNDLAEFRATLMIVLTCETSKWFELFRIVVRCICN